LFSNYTHNELLIKYDGNPHGILNLRLKFRLVITYFGQKTWERISNANLLLKLDDNITLRAHQINGCILVKDNKQSEFEIPDLTDLELQSINWLMVPDNPETNKKYISSVCNRTHDPLKYMPFITQFMSQKQLKCVFCSRHVRYDSRLSLLLFQQPQLDIIGQQYNDQISPGSNHVIDEILMHRTVEDTVSQDYPYYYIEDKKCVIYYPIPQNGTASPIYVLLDQSML